MAIERKAMPKFRIVSGESRDEVFADGMTSMYVNGLTLKIILHQVVRPRTGETGEDRHISARLVLPTTAAVQMAKAILAACKASESQLLKTMREDQPEKLIQLLEGVSDDLPSGVERTSHI